MPILYPANLYSLEVETMVEDVPTKFRQYWRLASGSPAAFPALDLVNAWAAAELTLLKAILSSTVQVMRIIGRCMRPVDGIPYEANYADTDVGSAAAEPLPPSIAILLKFRSNSPSSRNNGHVYISGCPESGWVNGAWTAGILADAATLADGMGSNFAGANPATIYTPCVVSRFLNGVERVTAVTYDIVSTSVSTNISQQRRRQSGKQGIVT